VPEGLGAVCARNERSELAQTVTKEMTG